MMGVSARPRVLITLELPSPGMEMLQERFECDVLDAERVPREEVKRRLRDCDGMVALLSVRVDDDLMDAAPRLRAVANYAVGFNNLDVPAMTRRGVLATNTPGVLTEATADLAFALILAAARRIAEGDRLVRAGQWTGWHPRFMLGTDVYGKVLGIIGFGRIGRAVARRARAFDMPVLYAGRHPVDAERETELGARYVPLDQLLRGADFVSIHAPLNDETRHLIAEAQLRLMKREAYLINTARGPIVDEGALARALREGWIAGAGLDVYEDEPRVHPELLRCENAVLLPHVGSATINARAGMAERAARNLIAALDGQRPPNLLNPEALARTARH
jgi:glyoxylate reductase